MLIAIGPESADSNFFVYILRANVGGVPIVPIDQIVSVMTGLPFVHQAVFHEVLCLPHANLVTIKCGIDFVELIACQWIMGAALMKAANPILMHFPERTKGRMNLVISAHML